MKMNLLFAAGLILTTGMFTSRAAVVPAGDEKDPQKKEQHIKVMVKQDGKEIKIDTTFTLPDEKAIQSKVDSMLKIHGIDVKTVKGHKIMVISGRNHPGLDNPGDSLFRGKGHFSIMMDDGDSILVNGRKKLAHVFGRDMKELQLDLENLKMPHMADIQLKGLNYHLRDPFAMDPNDEDIVSYDRKDIGKGLEKITIVRKKHDTTQRVVIGKPLDEVKIEKKIEKK